MAALRRCVISMTLFATLQGESDAALSAEAPKSSSEAAVGKCIELVHPKDFGVPLYTVACADEVATGRAVAMQCGDDDTKGRLSHSLAVALENGMYNACDSPCVYHHRHFDTAGWKWQGGEKKCWARAVATNQTDNHGCHTPEHVAAMRSKAAKYCEVTAAQHGHGHEHANKDVQSHQNNSQHNGTNHKGTRHDDHNEGTHSEGEEHVGRKVVQSHHDISQNNVVEEPAGNSKKSEEAHSHGEPDKSESVAAATTHGTNNPAPRDDNDEAMCCKALTAKCMACAKKTTVDAYCTTHPDTIGCDQVESTTKRNDDASVPAADAKDSETKEIEQSSTTNGAGHSEHEASADPGAAETAETNPPNVNSDASSMNHSAENLAVKETRSHDAKDSEKSTHSDTVTTATDKAAESNDENQEEAITMDDEKALSKNRSTVTLGPSKELLHAQVNNSHGLYQFTTGLCIYRSHCADLNESECRKAANKLDASFFVPRSAEKDLPDHCYYNPKSHMLRYNHESHIGNATRARLKVCVCNNAAPAEPGSHLYLPTSGGGSNSTISTGDNSSTLDGMPDLSAEEIEEALIYDEEQLDEKGETEEADAEATDLEEEQVYLGNETESEGEHSATAIESDTISTSTDSTVVANLSASAGDGELPSTAERTSDSSTTIATAEENSQSTSGAPKTSTAVEPGGSLVEENRSSEDSSLISTHASNESESMDANSTGGDETGMASVHTATVASTIALRDDTSSSTYDCTKRESEMTREQARTKMIYCCTKGPPGFKKRPVCKRVLAKFGRTGATTSLETTVDAMPTTVVTTTERVPSSTADLVSVTAAGDTESYGPNTKGDPDATDAADSESENDGTDSTRKLDELVNEEADSSRSDGIAGEGGEYGDAKQPVNPQSQTDKSTTDVNDLPQPADNYGDEKTHHESNDGPEDTAGNDAPEDTIGGGNDAQEETTDVSHGEGDHQTERQPAGGADTTAVMVSSKENARNALEALRAKRKHHGKQTTQTETANASGDAEQAMTTQPPAMDTMQGTISDDDDASMGSGASIAMWLTVFCVCAVGGVLFRRKIFASGGPRTGRRYERESGL